MIGIWNVTRSVDVDTVNKLTNVEYIKLNNLLITQQWILQVVDISDEKLLILRKKENNKNNENNEKLYSFIMG